VGVGGTERSHLADSGILEVA